MNPAQPVTPKPSSWRWPAIIIALLSIHIILMAAVAVIASRDRSFAVVPNYYQKAQNWDKTQAQLRASEKLGWQINLLPAIEVDPLGRRNLAVELRDAKGSPIANATVELAWFHDAHANQTERATLTTDSAGKAAAAVTMRYAGEYDFHIEIARGVEKFIGNTRQYVESVRRGGDR